MKNTKKVISLFLALIMCLGSFVFTASAEGETFTEGYYTYKIENGGATITDVDDSISGDVVVPETLGGYQVKKIDGAFDSCCYMTSVVIPDTVEVIKDSFYTCIQLETVAFSENLKEITGESFSYCLSLKEIAFPSGLKEVGGFNVCTSLESVDFSEGLKSITGFSACHKLRDIEFPSTLETLGGYTFGCTPLTSIVIPENVTNIGTDTDVYTFVDCILLKEIYILSDNAQITPATIGFSRFEWLLAPEEYYDMQHDYWMKSAEYVLTRDEKYQAEAMEIIAAVEANGKGYETNQPVAGVTIYGHPGSTAEAYATENGLYFEELGNEITEGWCGDNIRWNFDKATGKLTLTGSGEMYDYSYAWDSPWNENELFPYVKSIEVGEGITIIGGGAFAQCYKAESVSLPSTLKEIREIAFAQCVSLKGIDLPQGLEKLGEGCFGACMSLEEITIPAKVKEIPAECFGDCCSLKTVYLPDSLEKIGERVFAGCSLLSTLTIPEAVTSIGYCAFRGCPTLKSLYILNPDFDFDVTDTYIGKWIWSVDTDDRVRFFETYSEKIYEYTVLAGDINFGVVDYDSMTDEEKAEFEAIKNEINAIFDEMENVQAPMGSGDDVYLLSDLLTVHGYKNSTAEAYAEKMGLKFEEIIDKETVFDTSTNTEAIFNKGTFPKDVRMKVEKGGENANYVFSGLFSRYVSYDITFESDGKEVQPDGSVRIKIKLPLSFNSKNTKVYYVDENGNKTLIPSEYIDGYIVFETDHFSEYVLVDESSKIEEPSEPETPEEPSDECNCKCHKNFMTKILYKILNFFRKLFGASPCCEC